VWLQLTVTRQNPYNFLTMNQPLTLDSIAEELRSDVSVQSRSHDEIDGVKIFHIKSHKTEDGSFSELLQMNDQGALELVPDFHIAQINRSIMLPNTVKAWHFHFAQDEVWNVSARSHVLLGLWDVREHSSTKNVVMRIPLTHESLVYIPRGVAHGVANHLTHAIEIYYFVNNKYNPENPDEKRFSWDKKGQEFWNIPRE